MIFKILNNCGIWNFLKTNPNDILNGDKKEKKKFEKVVPLKNSLEELR